MAHSTSYAVSFSFRFLPAYKIDEVMAFNADQAAKSARQDLLDNHGFTDDDFKNCVVSTSRIGVKVGS